MERLYNAKEVAEILGVSLRTVRQLIADKELKTIRVGKKMVRISKDNILEYLNENTESEKDNGNR